MAEDKIATKPDDKIAVDLRLALDTVTLFQMILRMIRSPMLAELKEACEKRNVAYMNWLTWQSVIEKCVKNEKM